MRDPHGGIRGVDALAPGPRRSVYVDAQVVGVDLDVHLLGFRQHRHGDGRGVNASLGFGRRHALHAVGPALVLQCAVSPRPLDHGDDFLEAAHPRGMMGEDFHLPPAVLGIAGIHAEQIAGKEPRFLPTGAGPDFQNDILGVVGVFGQQQHFQILLELLLLK